MIRADDTPELPRDFHAGGETLVENILDAEEKALAYMLDAECDDAAAQRRPGEMFDIMISREVSENVVAAVKQRWESGGWVVGAFEIFDGVGMPLRLKDGPPDEFVFRLVFARPHKNQMVQPLVEAEEYVPCAPQVEQSTSVRVETTARLHIRMPTRSRPAQALEVLQKYRSMAVTDPSIEVVIDEDDTSCNNSQFLQSLSGLGCEVTIGKSKSKIAACNTGRFFDWDVLVLASDDMVPVVQGYDRRILDLMAEHYPLFDGALCLNDGYNKDHTRPGEPVTCTIPILTREVFRSQLCWHVYYPGYKSSYCDTDQTLLLRKLNRITFVDEVLIEHRHFANARAPFDALYAENAKHDDEDCELFVERREKAFGIPTPKLSILICSMPHRRQQLERLVRYLRWQEIRWTRPAWNEVEIRVDCDPVATVGDKRQRLLNQAVGDYVAFIDDDDWIDVKYVERVVAACLEGKDCVSLVGEMTIDGRNPQRFEHSLVHKEWATREDGVLVRSPNHLNAIRRDIALRVGFGAKSVGEDFDFSQAVLPLLTSEASTGDTPLYFYWHRTSDSVQAEREAAYLAQRASEARAEGGASVTLDEFLSGR